MKKIVRLTPMEWLWRSLSQCGECLLAGRRTVLESLQQISRRKKEINMNVIRKKRRTISTKDTFRENDIYITMGDFNGKIGSDNRI